MNTYTLTEKLETMDCRRDDKARRVSNVAPNTVAEITAEELENGVTLERLETLNVPALLYSTQVTIHGKLPAFNPAARPGGYKAVFQNGNGSVGVKFSAIDAEKKALLSRIAKVSAAGWVAHKNSSGFELVRYFTVYKEEDRAAQKQKTIDTLRALPVSLFYGSAGAFALAYGLGYGVSMHIGAIPAADLWAFIATVFPDVGSPETLATLERAAKEEQDRKDDAWRAECEERRIKNAAEEEARKVRFAAFLATLPAAQRLETAPLRDGGEFTLYLCSMETETAPGTFKPRKITVKKRGGSLCYNVDGGQFKRLEPARVAKFEEQAKAGRVFGEPVKAAAAPVRAVSAPVTVPAPENGEEPASPRQTFALYCATGKDFRARGLTRAQAHAAISASQPFRGNKVAGLAAVESVLAGFAAK
jgi:hypothetical protein